MKKHTLLVLLFVTVNFIAPLRAEPIRVELTTQTSLAPVYLCKIQDDSSNLSAIYLQKLVDVLHFDFDHNGYTKVVPSDEILEKTLLHRERSVAFNPQRWAKIGVMYVVRGVVTEGRLKLLVFSVRDGNLKEFKEIALTSELHHDRRLIHKSADAILKTLFDAKPVATDRILFSLQKENSDPNTKQWRAEIVECDWDGGNVRQVTHEDSYSITPVCVPPHPQYGGDRFLYVSYKMGQPKIYFSSLDKKTGKRLIELRGNQLLPTISPKRDKLAFISDATGRADLFVQEIEPTGNLKGKPVQLFSYPRATHASPTFSPDGKKVAFVSDKDGTPRVYIIPTEAPKGKRASPKLITKLNRENTCPSWSPDGTKLAYSAKTGGVRQIWIYDFETKTEQQLTSGSVNKENPVWASNGLHLLFNSTEPNSSELYLINLNQPEAVKITAGPGKKHYPTWGTR